jgi:hypothetical protein
MAQFEYVKFTTGVKAYREACTIDRDDNVLGYHLINTGSCICFVNQLPIYPSGVLDTMYTGSQDMTKYTIKFDGSGAAIAPELTVISFNKLPA